MATPFDVPHDEAALLVTGAQRLDPTMAMTIDARSAKCLGGFPCISELPPLPARYLAIRPVNWPIGQTAIIRPDLGRWVRVRDPSMAGSACRIWGAPAQ